MKTRINLKFFAAVIIIFSCSGFAETKITYPSLEVLSVNRHITFLYENIAAARMAADRAGICYNLGRASSNQEQAVRYAAKVGDLMMGLLAKGVQPPEWLTSLMDHFNSLKNISSLVRGAAEGCLKLKPQVEQANISILNEEVSKFTLNLYPFVQKAIDELNL